MEIGSLWRLALTNTSCVSLPHSGAGVRADSGHRGSDDGNGGDDHVPAEPLQAVSPLLHQPAQPGQEERRRTVLSK